MMRNLYFERMTEAYRRNRIDNPMLKAALSHHAKQRELHKQHLHLLTQTFARTRQYALRGDYKEVQNAYKDYITHSKKLVKQSMNHFSKFSQETQPTLHKHWKNYTDFSRKAAKETINATKKVTDAITPKEVKKTAKTISSLAPVKAAQSIAKRTTSKLAKKASPLSKSTPKVTKSLSPLKSATSAKTQKSLKMATKSSRPSSKTRSATSRAKSR
jgi:hypothetical protein